MSFYNEKGQTFIYEYDFGDSWWHILKLEKILFPEEEVKYPVCIKGKRAYLKNIILLQAFPDANHRTALTATERFLEKNGYSFDYTAVEAYQFQKDLYSRRLHEYGTYEERPISILKESDNQVFLLCLEFVKAHFS